MDYSNVNYKKTVLSQVIVRLDFFEFIDERQLFCDNIEMIIMKSFPIKGKQQIVRFQMTNFTINPKETKTENSYREGVQRIFSDNTGNKFVLSNKYAVWEINKYTSYDDVWITINPILEKLFEYASITVVRTGIRYINEYNNNTLKPKKSYFTIPISSMLDTKVSLDNCIRMMNMTEYIFDDMRLNFRFGLSNPNYPQPVKNTQFILDYDCFCEEMLNTYTSVSDHINKGHDCIQSLFEKSITDTLRTAMDNE